MLLNFQKVILPREKVPTTFCDLWYLCYASCWGEYHLCLADNASPLSPLMNPFCFFFFFILVFFGSTWFLFWVSDFGSLLFVSHSLMSDSLRPHGLYNARHPCPSPLIFLKLMPIESMMPSSHLLLCHLLLLLPSIVPASESFPINGLFTTSGQTIGASALALVLLLNIQC